MDEFEKKIAVFSVVSFLLSGLMVVGFVAGILMLSASVKQWYSFKDQVNSLHQNSQMVKTDKEVQRAIDRFDKFFQEEKNSILVKKSESGKVEVLRNKNPSVLPRQDEYSTLLHDYNRLVDKNKQE